jgi:hypothetical protein
MMIGMNPGAAAVSFIRQLIRQRNQAPALASRGLFDVTHTHAMLGYSVQSLHVNTSAWTIT